MEDDEDYIDDTDERDRQLLHTTEEPDPGAAEEAVAPSHDEAQEGSAPPVSVDDTVDAPKGDEDQPEGELSPMPAAEEHQEAAAPAEASAAVENDNETPAVPSSNGDQREPEASAQEPRGGGKRPSRSPKKAGRGRREEGGGAGHKRSRSPPPGNRWPPGGNRDRSQSPPPSMRDYSRMSYEEYLDRVAELHRSRPHLFRPPPDFNDMPPRGFGPMMGSGSFQDPTPPWGFMPGRGGGPPPRRFEGGWGRRR